MRMSRIFQSVNLWVGDGDGVMDNGRGWSRCLGASHMEGRGASVLWVWGHNILSISSFKLNVRGTIHLCSQKYITYKKTPKVFWLLSSNLSDETGSHVWLLWYHKMYHQKYWQIVVVVLHIGLGFSSICVWSIWIVDFSVGNVGQHWAGPCYADSGTALAMWEGHYKFSLSKLFHCEGW